MTDPDTELAREIKTSNGYTFIVDKEDYERVSGLKWNAFHGKARNSKEPYIRVATTVRDCKGKRNIYIGRFILGVTNPNIFVDHINKDTLDNRRCNLRTCNPRESSRNRKLAISSVKFSGVHKEVRGPSYRASCVGAGGKRVTVGFYPTMEEAAIARDAYVIKHYGGFGHLNFPILKTILNSVRQEENEACAKVVENYKVECCDGHMFETGDGSDYEDRCPLPLKMSTEIRQRMKEAK